MERNRGVKRKQVRSIKVGLKHELKAIRQYYELIKETLKAYFINIFMLITLSAIKHSLS